MYSLGDARPAGGAPTPPPRRPHVSPRDGGRPRPRGEVAPSITAQPDALTRAPYSYSYASPYYAHDYYGSVARA
eukprot:gene17591-18862_t